MRANYFTLPSCPDMETVIGSDMTVRIDSIFAGGNKNAARGPRVLLHADVRCRSNHRM